VCAHLEKAASSERMKVAVLACGPSLPRYYSGRDSACDLVVAVNTAGWLYPCDWLACSDRHIIGPVLAGEHPLPRVGFLTNKGWRDSVLRSGLSFANLPLYDRRLGNLTPNMESLAKSQGMTECGYTFPNALWFAAEQMNHVFPTEPRELHIYGFDCAESDDVAGVKGYHTPKRWQTELPWVEIVLRRVDYVIHGDRNPLLSP
jgi:hypothetical protein